MIKKIDDSQASIKEYRTELEELEQEKLVIIEKFKKEKEVYLRLKNSDNSNAGY